MTSGFTFISGSCHFFPEIATFSSRLSLFHEFSIINYKWFIDFFMTLGWKKFISHEAIMAPGGVLLHDGALLIRCALEIECRDANFAEDTDASATDSLSTLSQYPPA